MPRKTRSAKETRRRRKSKGKLLEAAKARAENALRSQQREAL